MSRLVSVLVVMTAAGGVASASFIEDGMGFVLEPNGDIAYTVQTDGSFQQVEVHLCIFEPTLGGVSGWECAIEIDGSPVAAAWQLAAGLDVSSDEELFQVGIGVGGPALRPGSSGATLVATWTGFITDPDDLVEFQILPYPGSVTFDEAPGYSGPGSAEDLQELVTPGGFQIPDFVVNGDGQGPFQDKTWGEVKTLYR